MLSTLGARQPLRVRVGRRRSAAWGEEAEIVVGQFERPDLGLDERVELVEIRLQIGGHRKIHVSLPVLFYSRQSARAAASGAYLGLSTAHLPSTSRRSFASSPASASVRSPRSNAAARSRSTARTSAPRARNTMPSACIAPPASNSARSERRRQGTTRVSRGGSVGWTLLNTKTADKQQ